MKYQSLFWAAACATLITLPASAQGNNHPPAYPFLCGLNDDKGFSQFVNIDGGLYWTGGANDTQEEETGLVVYTHGVAARSLSLQYQLGALQPGPQKERFAVAFIFFTDGSNTFCSVGPGEKLTRGFSISPAAHGFYNLTWNAAEAGFSGRGLAEVGWADGGDEHEASFQDYVTRVYVNGVLAEPQLHSGLANFCD